MTLLLIPRLEIYYSYYRKFVMDRHKTISYPTHSQIVVVKTVPTVLIDIKMKFICNFVLIYICHFPSLFPMQPPSVFQCYTLRGRGYPFPIDVILLLIVSFKPIILIAHSLINLGWNYPRNNHATLPHTYKLYKLSVRLTTSKHKINVFHKLITSYCDQRYANSCFIYRNKIN